MKITRAELLDRLKRAYEMEEVMAGSLIELAEPHVLKGDIPTELRGRALSIVTEIKNDTLRHRDTVLGIIAKLEGSSHGS